MLTALRAALIAASVLAPAAAQADGAPYYPPAPLIPGGPPHAFPALHNGSVMLVRPVIAHKIEIRYSVPSPGMAGLVFPGTVLLTGMWSGGVLYAQAYVFTAACPPMPYSLTGGIAPDGSLVLDGPAPVINEWDCSLLGFDWNFNSHLVFTPMAPPPGPPPLAPPPVTRHVPPVHKDAPQPPAPEHEQIPTENAPSERPQHSAWGN